MSTQQQIQHLNDGATEVKQLNPGGTTKDRNLSDSINSFKSALNVVWKPHPLKFVGT